MSLLLAALFLCCFLPVHSIIYDNTIFTWAEHSSPFLTIGKFGFQANGYFNLTIDSPLDSSLDLFICTDQQLEYIYTSASGNPLRADLECYAPAFQRCYLSTSLQHPTQIQATITPGTETVYHFIVANCHQQPVSISVQGYIINPGDHPHLGTTHEFISIVYYLTTGFWFLMLILALINTIQHHHFQFRLQRFLLVTFLIKILSLVTEILFWGQISDFGRAATFVSGLTSLFLMLWNISKFTSLFLVAKGWGITRTSLLPSECFFPTLQILTISSLFVLYRNYVNHIIPLTLAFIITMRFLYVHFHYNVQHLKTQTRLTQDATPSRREHNLPILDGKSEIYHKFQILLFIMVIGQLSVILVSHYLFTNQSWVQELLQQIIDSGLFLSLFVLFRVRKEVLPSKAKHKKMEMELLRQPLIVIQNPRTACADQTFQPCVQFGTLPSLEVFNV